MDLLLGTYALPKKRYMAKNHKKIKMTERNRRKFLNTDTNPTTKKTVSEFYRNRNKRYVVEYLRVVQKEDKRVNIN